MGGKVPQSITSVNERAFALLDKITDSVIISGIKTGLNELQGA